MKSLSIGMLIAFVVIVLLSLNIKRGATINMSPDFPVFDSTDMSEVGIANDTADETSQTKSEKSESEQSGKTTDDKSNKIAQAEDKKKDAKAAKTELATFGSGCFWCTEAFFQELKGVSKVESGYSGGTVKNPTYDAVCAGITGHAEVVQITYDPKVIKFAELLQIFWQTHDPTTLNRQGADVGTQYRSAIFFHNDEQKKIAESYKKKLDDAKVFKSPIVTEITKYKNFSVAEKYHQDYFKLNPNAGYCRIVIAPKMEKFKKVFGDKLKK